MGPVVAIVHILVRGVIHGIAWIVHTIRTWNDLPEAKLVARMTASDTAVRTLAFTPDGLGIAVTSGSKATPDSLWQVMTGRRLASYGHARHWEKIQFTPDGRTALALCEDKVLRAWNAADGTLLREVRTRGDMACLSPEGRRVLIDTGSAAELLEVETFRMDRRFGGHDEGVGAIALSPDGKWAATGSFDGKIRLFDLATGHRAAMFSYENGVPYTLTFAPDSSALLVRMQEISTVAFSCPDGALQFSVASEPGYEQSGIYTPDSRRLLLLDTNRPPKILDAARGIALANLGLDARSATSAAWSADGRTIAAPDTARLAALWNSTSGEKAALVGEPLEIPKGKRRVFNNLRSSAVALSPDGKLLATGSYQGVVTIWNIAQIRVR